MFVDQRPYYPRADIAVFGLRIVGALIVIVLLALTMVSAQLYFGGASIDVPNSFSAPMPIPSALGQ